MSKVESEHNGFDVRIGAVEALTESLRTAVEDLARNDDTADNARQAWITAAEERITKSEKQIDILRSSQPRAAELGGKVDGLQEQLQRALSDHHSILQKLRAVEAEMQTRRDEMEKIAQRDSLSDNRILMLRLDALELNRKENERRTEVMHMKIDSLEKQCQATNSGNGELQSRLDELSVGKENVRPTMETPTQVLQEFQSIYTQRLPESQADVPTQVLESSNPAFILVPESEIPTQVLHASPPSYEDISTSPFANSNRE
jgi:chromosome segregation ATPase